MLTENDQIDRRAFYRDDYEIVAQYFFETGEKVIVSDPGEFRVCRFCKRDNAKTSFKNESHTIPEFLGNRTVLSNNECDDCNSRLGREYEDHLAKWSHLLRSVLSIRGKNKYPTFKSNSFRVEPEENHVHIKYIDPSTPHPSTNKLPVDHELFGNSNSQPYIPFRAAMSLTKIAALLCPSPYIHEFRRAIDWLNCPTMATIKGLPVGYAFTPGPVPESASHAMLIRRTTDKPIPYMWFILQCRNFRLQSLIPLCESDSFWYRQGEPTPVSFFHFPSVFDENWNWGRTQFGTLDWSSSQPQRDGASVSLRFLSLKLTDG